jgi:formylglycine-generating enzyme
MKTTGVKLYRLFFLLSVVSTSIYSCKNATGSDKPSVMTGWNKNDPDGWLFTSDAPKGKTAKGMVYVKGGTFVIGKVKEDILHDWNSTPKRTTVSSYYIAENEITNYDYQQYISWLQYVFKGEEQTSSLVIDGAKANKNVWNNRMSSNDILSEQYFTHPSYRDYPVVGVTWLQAQRYCQWLTDRVNEKKLIDDGILSKNIYTDPKLLSSNSTFKTNVYKENPKDIILDSASSAMLDTTKLYQSFNVKSKNPRAIINSYGADVTSGFRLPTEAEWEYAALAISEKKKEQSGIYKGKEVFYNQVIGTKGKNKGKFIANFKQGTGDYGADLKGTAITNEVKAMPPNELGLYGMYGNVAEWVQDTYRPSIDLEANDFNYLKGNSYTEYVKDKKGKNIRVFKDSIQFDTLSDGRLLYKELPGGYQTKLSDDSRNQDLATGDEMYYKKNSTKNIYQLDSTSGKIIKVKKTGLPTTYVKENSKVIKGGSWKDNSYWIDPGQRRFMSEDKSTNWIGFRVAQNYTGGPGTDVR